MPILSKTIKVSLFTLSCAFMANFAIAQDIQSYDPDTVKGFAQKDKNQVTLLSHDADEVVLKRIWFEPNKDIPAHGKIEKGKAAFITLLSGDLELGMGDKFDESKLKKIKPGALVVLTHENASHFARTGKKGAGILYVESFKNDFAEGLEVK